MELNARRTESSSSGRRDVQDEMIPCRSCLPYMDADASSRMVWGWRMPGRIGLLRQKLGLEPNAWNGCESPESFPAPHNLFGLDRPQFRPCG